MPYRFPAALAPRLPLKPSRLALAFAAAAAFWTAACDHGLAPPAEPPVGAVRAFISYEGAWPPRDSLLDLRFVAMQFVPQDATDLLELNRIEFSDRLPAEPPRSADTVVLGNVDIGAYVFSGVAQHYATDLLAWRPVGLYEENGGVFHVRRGETTDVRVRVDFHNPPPFPSSPTP